MAGKKLLIGICGLGGGGKDTTISILLEKNGGSTLQLREVVEDELRSQGKEINNTTLRDCATEMREKYGEDIVATRAIPKIKAALEKQDMVIINSTILLFGEHTRASEHWMHIICRKDLNINSLNDVLGN